jgi:hypothetical protein
MEILRADGLIVAEHSAGFAFSDDLPGFCKCREKIYGRTGVTIFARTD